MKHRLAALFAVGAVAIALPVAALANPGPVTDGGMHEWMTDEYDGDFHDGMHEWMTDEYGEDCPGQMDEGWMDEPTMMGSSIRF